MYCQHVVINKAHMVLPKLMFIIIIIMLFVYIHRGRFRGKTNFVIKNITVVTKVKGKHKPVYAAQPMGKGSIDKNHFDAAVESATYLRSSTEEGGGHLPNIQLSHAPSVDTQNYLGAKVESSIQTASPDEASSPLITPASAPTVVIHAPNALGAPLPPPAYLIDSPPTHGKSKGIDTQHTLPIGGGDSAAASLNG